ncbi:hypothetical protein Lfu02_34430 [Longispora fulva]|uniref:Uncharacterized protein n=1 Tax=Longispora fulva TaxID=619741 RepID=A0A8J7GR04_9ACTN|nr:hypothetical protein [Longispora fulva]MBG6141773.1 hypothetical protein [Longispora fulva]GIG59071.1 hypothetical protein Lfu02_34430 [Longispora fulva]
MSLCVDVFVRLSDGSSTVLDGVPGVSDSAGSEMTRHTLRWSPGVAELGLDLRLLPTLARADPWVGPEELDGLAVECAAIRGDIAAVAPTTGYGEEYVADRIGNIVAAIERARGVEGGGVVIW